MPRTIPSEGPFMAIQHTNQIGSDSIWYQILILLQFAYA